MIDDRSFLSAPLGPLGPAGAASGMAAGKSAGSKPSSGPRFAELLDAAGTRLKLSAHAQARLASRQIDLTPADWAKIDEGVERAAAKGAREALVVSEKAALVVSVANRTVITAVHPSQLKDNVFTNIDSAVLV